MKLMFLFKKNIQVLWNSELKTDILKAEIQIYLLNCILFKYLKCEQEKKLLFALVIGLFNLLYLKHSNKKEI
jgi:hypothetical protein